MLAVEAGADAVGVIFAPSARRVTPPEAAAIVLQVPASVEKVGVFVNEAPTTIVNIAEVAGLTTVQLHGDEDIRYIQDFRQVAVEHGLRLRVVKAVAVRPSFEEAIAEFVKPAAIDALLLDSPPASEQVARGGSGRTFDWELAAAALASLKIPVIVGGGLSPGNVAQAIARLQPWGVDVCSGVEREPGKKDAAKIRAFVAAARAYAANQVGR